MGLNIGDKAPGFKLYSSEKEEIALDNFAGKNVVLLFFPQAFTGVCTTELCSVRDGIADYNHLNAEVLAISVDSIFTLARFKEDQALNFRLLSDFNKEISAAYGALYEEFVFGMHVCPKELLLWWMVRGIFSMRKYWNQPVIYQVFQRSKKRLPV